MKPDEVCAKFYDSGQKIKVWEKDDTVFIQGTREGLLFLSELFAAQANYPDDGFDLGPFAAGHGLFSAGSTKGMYISRID